MGDSIISSPPGHCIVTIGMPRSALNDETIGQHIRQQLTERLYSRPGSSSYYSSDNVRASYELVCIALEPCPSPTVRLTNTTGVQQNFRLGLLIQILSLDPRRDKVQNSHVDFMRALDF